MHCFELICLKNMEENNKRIVKNTIYLYIRQFIIMALSFVSTRIVLDKLGASDYGVNNLVAGFVSMFAILNGILNSGTSRYMALAIGKGDDKEAKLTFSTAVVIHLFIALVVVIALESFGLWFLNYRLNIVEDRMFAANIVFQISVLSTFISITQITYSAAVTAHEKFGIYAYMSIFDVVAKILVLFLLVYLPYDKLIVYCALQLVVTLLGRIIYNWYCNVKFEECTFSLKIDKALCRQMLQFSGWTAFGQLIFTINGQGISILLNLFYNTVLNAARGLSNTVLGVITQFITGFMVAAQPQLVKYYGKGDMDRFNKLIFNVTQYSLFLVAIIGVPVIMEIDYVLGLWLGDNVPPYTSTFIRITMICNLVYKGNQMVENGIIAIGKVKALNTMSIPLYLLTLPLFYFALKTNMNLGVSYSLATIPPCLCFLVNIFILSKYTGFPGLSFFIHVFLRTTLLVLVASIIPFILRCLMDEGVVRFFVVCSASVICTFATIYNFGLENENKKMVKDRCIGMCKKVFRQ